MFKPITGAFLMLLIGVTLLMPALHASRDGRLFADQVAVLMYHHVHDTDVSSSTISSQLLEDQLTYLRERGYSFITLRQFESFMEGASVPDNAVLVTFDDGYESFYSHAFPILDKLNVPAVSFVITDRQADPQSYQPPFMSVGQIKELTSSRPGFISAQCHTDSMHSNAETPYMTTRLTVNGVRETEDEYRRRLIADTQACIRQMSPLGPEPVNAMAYPYGVFDDLSSRLMGEAGIEYAFSIVPEMVTRGRNPLQLPRINAGSPNISPQKLHETIMRRIVIRP